MCVHVAHEFDPRSLDLSVGASRSAPSTRFSRSSTRLIGVETSLSRSELFGRVWDLAHAARRCDCRAASTAARRARRDPVPQRTLVLLSGAHRRAVGSDLS